MRNYIFSALYFIGLISTSFGLVWQQDLCTTLRNEGISEGLAVAGTVGFLQAQDTQTVTYGTSSSLFAVDESTGQVRLGQVLDRETNSKINASFFAKDVSGNQITTTCEINILDTNDNTPVFLQLPYSVVVSENTAVNTVVFNQIYVRDVDLQNNAIVDLSCHVPPQNEAAQLACQKFSVSTEMISTGNYNGKITLKEPIDYETTTNYVLILLATDRGSPPRTRQINVEIQVQDVQDSPPAFLVPDLSFSIPENTQPNTALQPPIQVRDQDVGVPRPLSIKIISDPQNIFNLGQPVINTEQQNLYSVNLVTKATIDRETLGNSYIVEIQAVELNQDNQETSVSVTLKVSISIMDMNDNAPSFNQAQYGIQLQEQQPQGTDLPDMNMIVTDLDVGDNAFYQLSIQNDPRSNMGVPMSSVYSLSPIEGIGTTSVILVVNSQEYTDYEVPNYRTQYLQVVAKETKTVQSLSSTATVTITLMDRNDNLPQFGQNQYSEFIREDMAVGTPIRTITATDSDSGIFGQITYSLSGTGSEKFSVNNQTGQITLAQKLDFETKSVYNLQFQATDGGGRTQSVPFLIYLTNYNDEGPVFNQNSYSATLLENTIVLQPSIQVLAVDVDSDFPVTYAIISGNTPDNKFSIDTNTGLLSVTKPIDINESPTRDGVFKLLIEASDNGRQVTQKSTVYAIITIRDINNNPPVFGKAVYTTTIPEVIPVDTPVVNVSATDMDMNENAVIKYIILQGHRDNFKIDENTGVISTTVSNLNIERFTNRYDIVVHAVDGGSPQNTGTALVEINVIDSNNQIPTFTQSSYVFTVFENAPVGTTVDSVIARDPDSTAFIIYTIKSGSITAKDKNGNAVTSTIPFDYMTAFNIRPTTGAIYTTAELNRNQVADVTFTVQANDTNAQIPKPQIGITTVQINILPTSGVGIKFPDQGNENPVFAVTVAEETALNSVILQVSAIDVQTGEQITDYREVPGSDTGNFFTVEQTTGRILLNRRLDYETLVNKELSFQIRAFTAPPDPQTAVATIKVTVTDINDHSPSFNEDRYSYSVPEDYVYPTPLGSPVRATDVDSGNFSLITYSITGQGHEMFVINNVTGVITIAPNVTLDRESREVYNLLVHATDNVGGQGEKRITSVPLVITVQDINDNGPVFQQSPYNIYTLESVKADSSLGQVTAKDADSGLNGHVDYSITQESTPGLFYIETQTGIIRNKVSLEQKANELPYEMTVMAKDPTSQPRSAEVQVNIYVNDLASSDGKPRILYPPEGETFSLPEGSTAGTNVTQINAENRNPNQVSGITYGFLANEEINADSSKFNIDPKTGVITVKSELDYESQSIYELIIVIRTETIPPQQVERRIYVNVTDINDNKPTFRCPMRDFVNPMSASVSEGLPPRQLLAQVYACDADGPGNNAIYYYISCGNSKDSYYGDEEPFIIDSLSGKIYTNVTLDREHKDSYEICVQASNLPGMVIANVTGRQKRQAESDRVQRVKISVLDVDDNGPSFAKGRTFIAGVLATARYETPIIQVQASDSDTDPRYTIIQYSLRDEIFIHTNNRNEKKTPLAFKIDPNTGTVLTNLNNYINYLDGYFVMKVVATAAGQPEAVTNLFIYVVREFQRLRFIFNQKPIEVKDFYQIFLSQVNGYFTPTYQINSDSMHYNILEEGRVNFDKTDLCFHMVSDNKVVNADTALKIFDERESDPTLQQLYYTYNVEDVDICEVKTTTKWWSGYWWLWWLLIALALFIFIVCLIMICCVCYFWPKYKRNYQREKPYVVLDQPMSSYPDYEWQEEIVKMD